MVRGGADGTEEEKGSGTPRTPGTGGAAASRAAVVAVAVVAWTGIAGAQEPPDSAREARDSVEYRLEGITVEAARPTTTAGGASALEVRLDSMEAVPAPTLGEILRTMPLIRIRRNSRGQQQPSLRGVEERQIAVLVDGIPITLGWDNRTDLSVVPVNAAREVTMIRGLSSVLAGPNVLGGVVMVGITRGPRPERIRTPLRAQLGVEHTGAVSLDAEASRVWHPGHSTVMVRGGGGLRDSPGMALPGGVEQPVDDDLLVNTDYASRNAFVAARWWGRNGGWVSFSSLGYDVEKGVLPELHIAEPRRWRVPEEWRSLTAVSGGTGWRETPFGEGDVEAMVGVDFGRQEIDAFESVAYAKSVGGQTNESRTLTGRLLSDHTLGPGMVRSSFTFADVLHHQREAGSPRLEYRQRLWSAGLEIEEPVGRLVDIPSDAFLSRPTINAGVSLDGSSTPETGDKPSREGIDGWGGRAVGGVHVAGGAARLHGGFSRKVRFPALRELFSGALGKFEPNPGLGPEVLKVTEVGLTGSVGGVEAQATFFQQRLEGAIVRAATGTGRLRRENRNEIRSSGVELLANARVGSWSVGGDLTLQEVELRDPTSPDAERVEYQPEVMSGVHARGPLPLGMVGRARLRHEGRQYCVNPDTGAWDPLDPDVSVEVGASRRVPPGVSGLPGMTFSVTASNLTDETLYEQCGIPSAGRTIRIQLDVR